MKVKAAVLEKADGMIGKYRVRIEGAELEGPRADEVLVRVTSCGVCGTTVAACTGSSPIRRRAFSAMRARASSRRLAATSRRCGLTTAWSWAFPIVAPAETAVAASLVIARRARS
jgi:hypothetical protein